MMLTLGTAAKASGKSKATIHRAIKSGLISAEKKQDGSYVIQPVELFRVFPPVSPETGAWNSGLKQAETPPETVQETPGDVSLAVANARLEAEIAGLKEIVRVHREQVEDLRNERDRLLGQVEAGQRLLTHFQSAESNKGPRSWWRRFVG